MRRLGRRGKYLIGALEGDVHLVMHLRMTGNVLYDAAPGSRIPASSSSSTTAIG